MTAITQLPHQVKLVSYALGIFLCYFLFGIFQEKITRSKYGPKEEIFTSSISLVFVSCFINMIFARMVLLASPGGRDTVQLRHYISCAVTYLTAMVSSNLALQHVNYPTQVIGKSCKPIPVMILGVLYGRKSYPLRKYFFILMIVVGVALFIWKDSKTSKEEEGNLFGYLLLMFSLAMDGFTGGIQDRMRHEGNPKFAQMMYNINKWSTLFLGIALIGTGELWTFTEFVKRYPYVVNDMFYFSILSALGQLFIFLTVQDFGPLPLSLVTTTRKFFTVLASIIYFGHPATTRQFVGTALIFIGLGLDSWKGKEAKKSAPSSPSKESLLNVQSKD